VLKLGFSTSPGFANKYSPHSLILRRILAWLIEELARST
jgi:hypothetical protein